MSQFVKVNSYITEDLDKIQRIEQYINLNEVVRFIVNDIEGETRCILYCKNYDQTISKNLTTYIVHTDSYPLIDSIMNEAQNDNEMVLPF